MSTTQINRRLDTECVRAWFDLAATEIHDHREYLMQLDAAIGDADHGANMDHGFAAVCEMLRAHSDDEPPGALVSTAGASFISMGGASGVLWGTALLRAGATLGNAIEIDVLALTLALQAALDGIVELGAARVGDKTMVDALEPTVSTLSDCVASGISLTEAMPLARRACEEGMRATVPMLASKGRASYLGERSIGHQDPGATSTVIFVSALDDVIARND